MKQAFVEVFVGGLPPDATDEGVESAFAAVGPVLSVRLNRRKKTGECKGFGFIRYADQATAENACQGVKEVKARISKQSCQEHPCYAVSALTFERLPDGHVGPKIVSSAVNRIGNCAVKQTHYVEVADGLVRGIEYLH